MTLFRFLLIFGSILAAGRAWSAILVASSGESAIIARETDGIWETGMTSIYNQTLPTGLLAGNSWRSIDAGNRHGLAVDGNGMLFAWGNSDGGALGTGDAFPTNDRPLRVGSDIDWKSVSAGGNLSAAIKTNGSLWAWGQAIPGESASTGSRVPVSVDSSFDWKSVATGYLHRLAIRNDGSLWAWGYNSHGTLGDGTYFSQPAPVRVGTDNDWASAAGGVYTSFGLKQDGSLWIWGDIFGTGSSGYLGSETPVRFGTDSDWKSIHPSTSRNYVLAIKQDGSLWSWGENTSGVLGLGDTLSRVSPVRVGTAFDWSDVAPGDLHVVATKTDGTIWHWGHLPGTQFPQSSLPVDRSSSYAPQPKLRIEAENRGTLTSGGTWTLRTNILDEPTPNFLRLYNDGMAPVLVSAINVPAGFTLDTAPLLISPLNLAICQVRLAAAAKGTFSGTAHIVSNHPGMPDFTFTLNGTVVSSQDDTDSDGLNDAAEVSMAALGFVWNSSQPALVETLHSKSKLAGLISDREVFKLELKSHPPVINPTSQTARLQFELRNSDNGNPIPWATGGVLDSGIQLSFQVPENYGFVRVRGGVSE